MDIPPQTVSAFLTSALRSIKGVKIQAYAVDNEGRKTEAWKANFTFFTITAAVTEDAAQSRSTLSYLIACRCQQDWPVRAPGTPIGTMRRPGRPAPVAAIQIGRRSINLELRRRGGGTGHFSSASTAGCAA